MSLDEAEIRRLVHKGMTRPDAQVSVDEAVHALGDLEPDPEIIEHLRTRLAEHGVELESAESDVAALLEEGESDLVERRQRDRQQLLVRESMRSGSGGTPLADPVRMYLREIGRVPLLTAQEERELSALIQRGIAAAARLAAADPDAVDPAVVDPDVVESPESIAADDADRLREVRRIEPLAPEERARLRREVRRGEAARTELTQANLRLVVSIAKRYATSSMPLLDLVQEGNLGLMRAVEKFDGEKGFKFSTYATWWIRQAITRAVADQSRTIRIPVHMVEAMNKLLRIRIDLTQRLEREPTLDELAAAADLPLERVEELLRIAVDPLSLDMPMGEESDASLGDRVQDDSADSPAEVAETVMLHQAVAEALADLAPREQELLRMRFGLDDGRPRTLEEVARSFNVTRERVRQIETKTLMKLGRSDHGVRLIEYLQN